MEPGRFLVAQAGVLVAQVTQLKGKGEVQYVGIATGMNSLIRPALYGSHHDIVNLTRFEEPSGSIGQCGGADLRVGGSTRAGPLAAQDGGGRCTIDRHHRRVWSRHEFGIQPAQTCA